MLTRWIGTFLATAIASGGAPAQQDVAAPTLEALLVEALADPEWQVRRDAASLLGVFGTSEHARHLHAVLDDDRSEVWKLAWRARLALRPEEVDGAIARIMEGETWEDVSLLSRRLVPLVRAQDTPSLVAAFDRAKSTHGQYALLVLLAHLGADLPAPVVAYARECTTPLQIWNASQLLPLLPDAPEHRERVTGWLDHTHPIVRHRCAAWLQRHGDAGAAIVQHLIPDFVEQQVYEAESVVAEQALGAEWLRTSKAEVLAAAGRARVVLIAEKHGAKAIPDLVAACCVASMKGSELGKVAFGYEAPVESSFAHVKPRAEALGLVPIPLEPAEQLPSLRSRDAAINANIRAWLDRSPEHKMVALYGAWHVLGKGHVDHPGAVRILTVWPAHGLLTHLRAEALGNGTLAAEEDRWFVHRTQRDTYFVICDDLTWYSPSRGASLDRPDRDVGALTAWLANKLRK
jgi:hypothetical protein